ncbi:mycofactocin precursor MftA [Streptomyces sp. BH055]
MNEQLQEAPQSPYSPDVDAEPTDESLIEADDLVEEVSIDGMCGVY